MTFAQPVPQDEWVKILTKGIMTIPKKMREQLGIKDGDIAKIRVDGRKIIIEPKDDVSFEEVRQFSQKEIVEWIKSDSLPTELSDEAYEYWKDLP